MSFCGTCETYVADDCIGCDKCVSWYHSKPLCMVVSSQVIYAVGKAADVGVEFVFTQYRTRPITLGSEKLTWVTQL